MLVFHIASNVARVWFHSNSGWCRLSPLQFAQLGQRACFHVPLAAQAGPTTPRDGPVVPPIKHKAFSSFCGFLCLHESVLNPRNPKLRRRLGRSGATRSKTRSKEGPSLGPGCRAAGHGRSSSVLVTASWTATESNQPADAAARTAGGARRAWRRTRSRTKRCAPALHRPPTSQPSGNFYGPSSVYATRLRRSATCRAAPSTSAVHGWGCPVLVSGDTRVASSLGPMQVSKQVLETWRQDLNL